MNIKYKLTKNEYQEAATFHYKSGKRPLFVAIFIGFATFMLLVGTDFSNIRTVITNILVVFFAISFYILFTRMITAYQAKKIYTKSPILSNDVELRVSGKGIYINKTENTKPIPWDTFTKWKQNEKFYMLYTSGYQFNVIPKRAMSEKQIKEFEDYLEKYIPQNVAVTK